MNDGLRDPDLASAYARHERAICLLNAKVGCILALICMPLGSLLDFFVYPHMLWPFFGLRIASDLALLPAFALLFFPLAERYPKALSSVWPMVCNAAICGMIAVTEGAVSPYYAGLNLVIIVTCLLIPYTLVESLVFCLAVMGSYAAACVWHEGEALNASILFNNAYFLGITSLICVTACHYGRRRRIEDFLLRHKVDRQNAELTSANERLATLDKMKSEFFSNVTHELRTPLTLIISPLDFLLRDPESIPPKVHETLLLILQNGLRLLKLINDLLEVIRLEQTGRSRLSTQPVNVAALLRDLTGGLRHLAQAKNLTLRCEDGPESLVIFADPGGLEKVVINLLTNAIKFTPPGGAISTRCSDGDGRAVIEISDTGIGIPEKEIGRIFDRFHQADGSETRRQQGVGIGLSLARDIVQQHGGRIVASSAPGKGSTFRVELPQEAREAPAQAPGAAEPSLAEEPILAAFKSADRFLLLEEDPSADLPVVGTEGKTVLVIDDEPQMRRFLVASLSREFRVAQAVDGESGLRKAFDVHPDVVLVDWMLPGKSGLDVCRELRRSDLGADIKIMLLTARTDEQSKILALREGADDFLNKPFSVTEVETRLSNLIRTAELQRDLRARNRELEEAMRRLTEAEAHLVQSEKMNAVGSLAAGLLHEINNPLNYTLTAIQLARRAMRPGDADLGPCLDDVQEGMERIRNIVSDLRTFAYPERQHLSARFDVVRSVAAALRLTAHELQGIRIESPAAGPFWAVGSETQITHVLMNLVVNSARAIADAGNRADPLIRIAVERAGDRLRVTVWDNGAGIPEAIRGRVFEPFFTTREVGKGMGLGLSVSHTIVKNHGGNFACSSQEGHWTEMVFDLPVVMEASS